MDVEVEHPHVHHPVGHRKLDLILPLAALFVSLVSIGIAYHHGHIMRDLVEQNERLVQANSLPWLQLYGSNRIREDGNRDATLSISNEGIGPGEVRSVQILVDGKPVQNLQQFLQACCGTSDTRGVGTSTLRGRMVRPGQPIDFIGVNPTAEAQPLVAAVHNARTSGRIETRVCYCSVFEECWTISSTSDERPKHVEQCPMPQPQYMN